jgi:hypothetical protein
MGNLCTKSSSNNNKLTNLDQIHTLDQFDILIKYNKLALHKQIINEKKGLNIYVCGDSKPYSSKYFVAQLTFVQTSEWPGFVNFILNDYTSILSYSFNIIVYNKLGSSNTLLIKKFYTPERKLRKKHMSDDLDIICEYLRTLDSEKIDEHLRLEFISNPLVQKY